MPFNLDRRERDRQPQGVLGVNWGNPLTRGLVFLANYGEGRNTGRNLVSGSVSSRIGTASGLIAGPGGRTVEWTNGAPSSDIFSRDASLEPSVGVTVGYFGRRISTVPAYSRPISVTHTNGTTPPYISYGVGINDASAGSDAISGSIGTGLGGYLASTPVTVTPSLTNPHVILSGWDTNSALISVYHNGLLKATKATSGSLVYSSAATGPLIISGSHPSSVANQFSGDIYVAFVWNRKLSDAEIKKVSENPWQLFEPEEEFSFYAASGGGGVSGTVAATNANDSPGATGTTTVTGSLARTNANDAGSASGTTTIVGTLARTNANDTASASGSPVVNGSLATTNANDTATASGSVGSSISGSVAVTNANDASSATGTTTVTGSLATTNANDSASANGTTTVTGTSAYTNANDSVVASGAAGTVTGTVNVTNANDTADAYGIGAPNNDSGDGSMSRKRYYLRRKGKILLFDTVAQADDYLEAEEEAQKAIAAAKSRGAKKRIAAKILKAVEPVESVEIAPLQELVKAYSVPVNLPQLLSQQDYSQVMDVRAMIQRIQDDEDDELLLLLA